MEFNEPNESAADAYGDQNSLYTGDILAKYGSAGTWNIYKILDGTQYAGTGTKEEMLELATKLRVMLSTGLFPYTHIETTLMHHGYPQKAIREQFKNLTGISVEDIDKQNQDARMTPSSIPQVNLGWGTSKKKDHDYLFVMPWINGYSVFGQSGDMKREEVKRCDDLESAREFCQKNTKDYKEVNAPLSLKKSKIRKDDEYLQFNDPGLGNIEIKAGLSDEAGLILEFLEEFGASEPLEKKMAHVNEAYTNNEISAEDYKHLSAILHRKADKAKVESPAAGIEGTSPDSAVADAFAAMDRELQNTSVDKELKENTADQYLDNESQDAVPSLSDSIRSVEYYIDKKNESLNGQYFLSVFKFKYARMDIPKELLENVDIGGRRPVEYLRSSGQFLVLLKITAAAASDTPRLGLLAFLLIDGKYQTDGTIKGVTTKRKYALDEDGLNKYFTDCGDISNNK
jgi:hypothetical protein